MKGPVRASQGLDGLWDSDLEFKEKIRRFFRLVDSVFRFRAAKTGGNRFDRLISLEEGVQPLCMVRGRFRDCVGASNWGNLNWENLLARLSLGTMRSWDINGETLAYKNKIWPTLGK
jgi:hypothetical protein